MRRGWAVRNGIGLIRCNSMKEKLRKKQEKGYGLFMERSSEEVSDSVEARRGW